MIYKSMQVVDGELVDVHSEYEYQINDDNKQDVVLTSVDYWCPDTRTWNSIEIKDVFYDRLITNIIDEIKWG